MTTVVNNKNVQYIGRFGHGQDGYFGNPFSTPTFGSRKEVIQMFRTYFYDRLETDPEFKRRVEELRGKILICFCSPLPCHGDIIKEYLDTPNLTSYRGEVG